jgi:hypothetical protein
MALPPLTTITFFRFPARKRWWAFSRMRTGPATLNAVPGVRFARLMGTGRGIGFDPRPNLRVYSTLAVWESVAACHAFLTGPWMAEYRRRAEEVFTVLQYPIRSNGTWGGINPFQPPDYQPGTSVRGVITRATIRTGQLVRFWQAVPRASRAAGRAEGRLFSLGIGEVPLVQQATYSLWESEDAIKQFAYRTHAHQAAIRDTHRYNWYSEELFARFAPVATIGTWAGTVPVGDAGVTRFADVPRLAELQAVLSLPEETAAP